MKSLDFLLLLESFAETDDCWVPPLGRNKGYSQVSISSKKFDAHRVAYILLVGEIPAGLDLDHLCRNRPCVNPRHLEPVTRKVNIQRGDSGKWKRIPRTHCRKGHLFTAETTVLHRNGARQCRICLNECERARHLRDRPKRLRRMAAYQRNHREEANERNRRYLARKRGEVA